jgi:acyl dehydratase
VTPDAGAVAALGPIPSLRITTTALDDLVRWSGAIDDYSPIHYDPEVANARGFVGPVVNGPWKSALLMRMLADWLDDRGSVQRLECRYESADIVGTPLTCVGKVVGSSSEAGSTLLDVEVWVENDQGVRSVTGRAVIRVDERSRATRGELPVERLKEVLKVGDVAGEFTYRVDPNDIARFRSAVAGANSPADDAPVPACGDIAPPTFYAALDPVERRDLQLEQILDGVPHPKTGGGNAFNEVVYQRPIRAGDVITVTTSYQEVYEREGRAGRLLFRVRDNELRDVDGHLVATTRMGHVHAFDLERTL